MSKINRKNGKKRSFAGIPRAVVEHPDFYNLKGNSIKLLIQLAAQYKGKNNGKLCAIFRQLKELGWRSEATLRGCLKELLDAELIVITKAGRYGYGGSQPNYYAVTWANIDDIPNFNMDVAPTRTPIRTDWFRNQNLALVPKND